MARALTAKGAATRQRIVVGAAELIRDRGPEQVGLDDVRAATATSKSQLFHYFPDGRAELLRAVAEHEATAVLDDQQPYLDQLGPSASWPAWRDAVVAKYREQGIRCPLTALTRQLGPTDPRIRDIVAELLRSWHGLIAQGIRRCQDDGAAGPAEAVPAEAVPVGAGPVEAATATGTAAEEPGSAGAARRADDLAAAILAAIQGGVVMMQATGQIYYLETALDAALAPLCARSAAPARS